MVAAADQRAIIIGAGVGGLTTAIALRRIGMHPLVFERASDVRKIQIGGGLQVWTNAMKALRSLDLMDPLLAVSADLGRCEFRSWSGATLIAWSVTEESRALGAPSVGVGRADLHRLLLDALGDGVVCLDAECTGFTQDDDGVTVRFADGREERGALLVGADGGRSTIRGQEVGPTPLKYTGYSVWQTVGHLVDDAVPPPDLFGMWYGRGKRFIFYRVGRGQQHWAAIVNVPQGRADVQGGRKAALRGWYKGWQAPIESMIEATDEADISRVDIYGRDPLNRWGSGRVTLLGDAAHPITLNLGQGACQAIEDAVGLAKHLNAEPHIPAALRAYELARMDRTATIMKMAWRLGVIGQLDNPVLCHIRDLGLRALKERVKHDTTAFSAYEV